MYAGIRRLIASVETSRVFSGDRYDWYTYQGAKPVTVEFRGKSYLVGPKDKFGVRDATSSPGKYRLVIEKLGVSRVMSPDPGVVQRLIKASKLAKG